MEQREIQQTFIRSAIRVIAQKGLVKATTKAIAADAGLNEAYIYKCFKGKDELLAEALHDRDEGLAVFLRREFPNVLAETSPWRDRCFHLWEKTWNSFWTSGTTASSISGITAPPTSTLTSTTGSSNTTTR